MTTYIRNQTTYFFGRERACLCFSYSSMRRLLMSTTEKFAQRLFIQFCLCDQSLVQPTAMISRLQQILQKRIDSGLAVDADDEFELTYEIFQVLSALKPEYIGMSAHELDPRIREMDMNIRAAIIPFLLEVIPQPKVQSQLHSKSEQPADRLDHPRKRTTLSFD